MLDLNISGFLLFERVEIYVHICKYVETVIVLVCVFARILKLNQLVMKLLTKYVCKDAFDRYIK